jgi:hypothetical protein
MRGFWVWLLLISCYSESEPPADSVIEIDSTFPPPELPTISATAVASPVIADPTPSEGKVDLEQESLLPVNDPQPFPTNSDDALAATEERDEPQILAVPRTEDDPDSELLTNIVAEPPIITDVVIDTHRESPPTAANENVPQTKLRKEKEPNDRQRDQKEYIEQTDDSQVQSKNDNATGVHKPGMQLPLVIRGLLSMLIPPPTPTPESGPGSVIGTLITALISIAIVGGVAFAVSKRTRRRGVAVNIEETIPFKIAAQQTQGDDLAKLGFSKL